MTTPAQFNEAIAKLREKFAATAGNTVQAFSALADQLQRMPTAPEVVEALRRELHRVHGTAGSYGFHEVSRLAAALELVASRWQSDPSRDRDRRAAIVRHFARSLESAFRGPSEGTASSFTHRVLLIDVDDDLAAQLVAEGVHRGHAVERASLGNLEPILDQYLPEVVICAARELPPLPEGVPIVMLGHLEGTASAGRMRILDPGADASEVMRIAESLAAQTGLAGASLYVVDDDPAMLEMLRSVGESEGMFVRTATTAEGLLEALASDPPAMLLLDAHMPGVGGVAATRTVRQDRRFADLPILMVSSSTDPALRAAAFAAGADDFQSKPVVTVELSRRITRLLEVRRQRQIARGIHPATSLWLPERTFRAFDEALTLAAQEGRAISLALLRPRQAPGGMEGAARWHREVSLVSGALAVDGVRCGFSDETALAVLLPMGAEAAIGCLDAFAEASEGEPIAWCGGVVEQSVDAERSARTLVHLAEEAWQMARDSRERLHRWDTADSGLAPDVVVVEDDPALADLLGYALSSRGLTHHVYRKGPEALAGLLALKVHERRPVVLMDIDLPGLDGFSLFERLRVERPRDFRVVFISVHASEGDQLRALRAGALDYIVKPVSLRVLMAKIAVWRDQDERP